MLKKEPGIIEEYEVVIKEQLQAGIIETVKKMESNSRAHYIPHHTVVRRWLTTYKMYLKSSKRVWTACHLTIAYMLAITWLSPVRHLSEI